MWWGSLVGLYSQHAVESCTDGRTIRARKMQFKKKKIPSSYMYITGRFERSQAQTTILGQSLASTKWLPSTRGSDQRSSAPPLACSFGTVLIIREHENNLHSQWNLQAPTQNWFLHSLSVQSVSCVTHFLKFT
jgi:hypothetical protein